MEKRLSLSNVTFSSVVLPYLQQVQKRWAEERDVNGRSEIYAEELEDGILKIVCDLSVNAEHSVKWCLSIPAEHWKRMPPGVYTRLLSGPFDGHVCVVDTDNAKDIFYWLIESDFEWLTDYSNADEELQSVICHIEFGAHLWRALRRVREIKFQNNVWCARSEMTDDEILVLGEQIELVLDSSKRIKKIVSDDDDGLIIGEFEYVS